VVVVGERGRRDKYVGSQPIHSEDRDVKVTVTVTSREIQSTNKKSTPLPAARPYVPTHTSYKPITSTNMTILQQRRTRHPANRAVGLPRDRSRHSSLLRCSRSHDRLRERPRQVPGPYRWSLALCPYKLGMRSTQLKVRTERPIPSRSVTSTLRAAHEQKGGNERKVSEGKPSVASRHPLDRLGCVDRTQTWPEPPSIARDLRGWAEARTPIDNQTNGGRGRGEQGRAGRTQPK